MAAGLILAAAQGRGHPANGGGGGAHADLGGLQRCPGQQLAASGYGWGPAAEATCLDELWTRNPAGGWSPTVTNPGSGAYGIPQALPASKMASAGADWQTNPATQIRWGLGYIRGTYGDAVHRVGARRSASDWY